jgi:hypothetical protein
MEALKFFPRIFPRPGRRKGPAPEANGSSGPDPSARRLPSPYRISLHTPALSPRPVAGLPPSLFFNATGFPP